MREYIQGTQQIPNEKYFELIKDKSKKIFNDVFKNNKKYEYVSQDKPKEKGKIVITIKQPEKLPIYFSNQKNSQNITNKSSFPKLADTSYVDTSSKGNWLIVDRVLAADKQSMGKTMYNMDIPTSSYNNNLSQSSGTPFALNTKSMKINALLNSEKRSFQMVRSQNPSIENEKIIRTPTKQDDERNNLIYENLKEGDLT